jgi:PAS domain S-box-containing protein
MNDHQKSNDRCLDGLAGLDPAEGEQAQLALAESEAKYRHLVETTDTGYAVLDDQGRVLDANDEYVRISGHHALSEIFGRSGLEWTAPWDVQRYGDELATCTKTGSIRQLEIACLHHDGSVISVEINACAMETGQGKRILALCRDISERKQAESALAYLASFPENNPNPVIEVGLGGDVRYLNASAHRLFPRLLDQGPAHPWLAGLPEVRRLFCEGGAKTAIHEVGVGDRWYQQSFHFLAEEQAVRIYGFDITERRQAEEALRHSHHELRTIYDGMIEGLVITDIKSKRFVRVNAALCRMLGYGEAELLQASIQDIHPPEEVSNDLARFAAVAEGRVSINENRPVLRKDGSVFFADITGRRIVYGGRPSLLALFRDVTDRKRAVEALHRERRTLKHMLEASDHERQLIAYDIHDGLAQELAGAIMQFQVYDHLKGTRPDEAQKACDGGMTLLRQSHNEVRRLISGVRPPILDESGVVAAVAHLAHDPVFEGGPRIDFRSRVSFGRLAPVLENVVYRIVQEGVTNACNHSQSKRIRVSLVQRGRRLHVEVRDWGVGFDPANRQANRFGLAGIRERARLLGGRCRIKSAPGEGTVVAVALPIVQREAE